MENVEHLPFVGIIFIIIGLAMVFLRDSFGTGFSRLGKSIWRDNPLGVPSDLTDKIYDEKKAPRAMFILGLSLAAGGIVFLFLPKLMQ